MGREKYLRWPVKLFTLLTVGICLKGLQTCSTSRAFQDESFEPGTEKKPRRTKKRYWNKCIQNNSSFSLSTLGTMPMPGIYRGLEVVGFANCNRGNSKSSANAQVRHFQKTTNILSQMLDPSGLQSTICKGRKYALQAVVNSTQCYTYCGSNAFTGHNRQSLLDHQGHKGPPRSSCALPARN